MFKKILMILCFFFIVIVTSCDQAQQQVAEPIQQQIDNTTQSLQENNLIFTVKTDKLEYNPGEIVNINLEIENNAKESISFTRKTPCEPDIYVYLDLSSGERIYLYEEGYEEKMCIQQTDTRKIPAQQLISRDVTWDLKLPTLPDKMPALPGKYTITSEFSYEYNEQTRIIKVLNEIEIKGDTKTKISKQEAIKIAYGNENIISWYNSHLGENIIIEEFGKYYIKNKYGRDRIDNQTAIEILESKPKEMISFENNIWKITFYSEYGQEPMSMKIEIDAETGEIVNIKEIENN
jgi:hypothetical protein